MNAIVDEVTLDLHDLYENAPCGYHSVGPDGILLRMNQTELTWLGFTQQELVGKTKFAALVAAPFRSLYARVLEGPVAGREAAEVEVELTRKDGSTFDAFLRIAAARDSRGEFLHTRSTVIDITGRKRAETEAQLYAAKLLSISRRVVEVQEAERRNLSAELHDRLGQDLAAINLNLHLVKEQLPGESRRKVATRLEDSIALVERAVEGVRDVAATLRPLVLDDYGLVAAVKSYCEQFSARTGIRITVTELHPVPRLQADSEMALFRITQEALTNVLKHAKATTVRMVFALDTQGMSLTIADDGHGFAPDARRDHRADGLGLLIMQERLHAVGGSLRIDSRPGAGTRLVAMLPGV